MTAAEIKKKEIKNFIKDFAEAQCCSVTDEGEIKFCFEDKYPHCYFQSANSLFHEIPSKTFNLPEETKECINYIYSKLNIIFPMEG